MIFPPHPVQVRVLGVLFLALSDGALAYLMEPLMGEGVVGSG